MPKSNKPPSPQTRVPADAAGRTVEQVQAEDFPASRLPDLVKETKRIRELYEKIERTETTAKLEIYRRLAKIYPHRWRLLEEEQARHFSKFIESLGVTRSTAFKDAKVIQFVTEFGIVDLLNKRTVKNLVRKLKEVAYKPYEIQEQIVPRLGDISLDEIMMAGSKKPQASWHQSGKLPKMRHRIKDDTILLEVKDDRLKDQLYSLIQRLDRKSLARILEMLDE